jgi:hypothetical protein
MAVTDWIQTAAVVYFAWQQNRIFERQNQILAGSAAMPKTSQIPWVARYWPTMVLVVLVALTAYDIYIRHGAPPVVPWWFYATLLLIVTVIGLMVGKIVPSDKPRTPSKLVIHSANYRAWHAGGDTYDVTEFLQRIISGNSLVLDIENHNFVIGDQNFVPKDHLFGNMKRLRTIYSYDGEPARTIERPEHSRLVLPEDSEIERLKREIDNPKTSGLESQDNPTKDLAKSDAANINKRIREASQRIEFHFSPGSDPYLDIITELWNGSVFQLVNHGELAGHVTYLGKQLAGEPRVVVSVEPPLLSLGHGESVTLTVRQCLSYQVAEMIEANRNRGVAIDFESVFVSFKILPLDGLTTMGVFKLQGPRFAIEDSTRI